LDAYEGVALDFTAGALRAIARKAQQRGTGARGQRGILENLLRRAMFELPSSQDVERCIVDENLVENGGMAEFVRKARENARA
jgi:ATP-dependent Clp protease ATP-binding subunit ClpX